MKKILKGIISECKKVEKRLEKLREEQSKYDRAISDVLHYIELEGDLNVVGGYKLYSLLKNNLLLRRDVKKSIQTTQSLNDKLKPTVLELKTLLQEDEEEERRVYKVKELTEEFGEFIKGEM